MHERLSSRSARPLRFLQFIKFGLSLWCRISLDMLRLSIRGCIFKKITKKYIDLNKYIIDIRVVYAIEFHYACSWNFTEHFLPNFISCPTFKLPPVFSPHRLCHPIRFLKHSKWTIFYSNFFRQFKLHLRKVISWLFTISCRQTQVKFLHILEVNFRHVSNVNETFFQNDKHDCIWTNIISSWANVQTYNNFTRKKNVSLSIRNCLKGITSCMWHFVIYSGRLSSGN